MTSCLPDPFDPAAGLHLEFDAVAVAYNKAIRASGLASGTPVGIETDADSWPPLVIRGAAGALAQAIRLLNETELEYRVREETLRRLADQRRNFRHFKGQVSPNDDRSVLVRVVVPADEVS